MVGGAGVDGHQPNAIDAQFLQVIQLGDDALEITNAIPIGVAEGVYENFVEYPIVIIGTFAQLGDFFQFLPCADSAGTAREQCQHQYTTQQRL